jgi:hypothetical protein
VREEIEEGIEEGKICRKVRKVEQRVVERKSSLCYHLSRSADSQEIATPKSLLLPEQSPLGVRTSVSRTAGPISLEVPSVPDQSFTA